MSGSCSGTTRLVQMMEEKTVIAGELFQLFIRTDASVVDQYVYFAKSGDCFFHDLWLEHDMPYTPKFMAANLLVMAAKGAYVNNPFL